MAGFLDLEKENDVSRLIYFLEYICIFYCEYLFDPTCICLRINMLMENRGFRLYAENFTIQSITVINFHITFILFVLIITVSEKLYYPLFIHVYS